MYVKNTFLSIIGELLFLGHVVYEEFKKQIFIMPSVDTMSRGHIGPRMPMDPPGMLLESMQLEEPPKSQVVPNHLLETSKKVILLFYKMYLVSLLKLKMKTL